MSSDVPITKIQSSQVVVKKISVRTIAFVAALAGLLFGYDTGVIGGSQLYFTEYLELTSVQQGWAVSSALYGALAGAICAGYLTKSIGRKYTLVLSAFLFTLSAWGSGIANTLESLAVFRILGGFGVGMASMTAPMYIAEVAPPKERGMLVSYYQLAVVVGFFVVFLATYYIGGGDTVGRSPGELAELHEYNVTRGWRVMLWSELAPAILFFILLLRIPHSPRWLMLKGRQEEAKIILRRINQSEEEARAEFNEIVESLSSSTAATANIFKNTNLGFVLFLGIMLSVFQQVTGINAILYYGAEIFSSALGYSSEDALKQQLWLGSVNLVFTFVAIATVDRWGRKPLLIVGTLGMAVGLSVLGLTIYFQHLGVLSLIAMLLFVASFALSMGPVVWVMLAEIFPNHVRSVAMSVAVAAQWLFNAIVANSFPPINDSSLNQDQFKGALPYFIFAFFCIVTIVFVWRLVPETKNKSLEEMETLWRR